MRKTFRSLCFVVIGLLLSVPALAREVQSAPIEFTKAPLDSQYGYPVVIATEVAVRQE